VAGRPPGASGNRRIIVWNRCDALSERNARLTVLLSDDGNTFQQAYRHDGTVFYGVKDRKPLVIDLQGQPGRFVRLTIPATNFFHLDEVEIRAPEEHTISRFESRPLKAVLAPGPPGIFQPTSLRRSHSMSRRWRRAVASSSTASAGLAPMWTLRRARWTRRSRQPGMRAHKRPSCPSAKTISVPMGGAGVGSRQPVAEF